MRTFRCVCLGGCVGALLGLGDAAAAQDTPAGEGLCGMERAAADVNGARDALRACYESACTAGDGSGCFGLGEMYESGRVPGKARDKHRALELFQKACPIQEWRWGYVSLGDEWDARACRRLASFHASGKLVRRDRVRALAFEDIASALGDQGAHRAEKTRRRWHRACGDGDFEACLDLARSRLEHSTACMSCSAGPDERWVQGEWALSNAKALDQLRVLKRSRTRCAAGDPWECYVQGTLDADPASRLRLYETACEGGVTVACGEAAQRYDEGVEVAVDLAKAERYYLLWAVPESANRVRVRRLQSACAARDAASCYDLATMFDPGVRERNFHRDADHEFGTVPGIERDRSRAVSLYRLSCDAGHAQACFALAVLYDIGDGVARDRDLAASLFRKACAGGERNACESGSRPSETEHGH